MGVNLQAGTRPGALRTEIHAIPLEDRRLIFYAPLRRTAFIGNASMARLIERLRDGAPGSFTPREAEAARFLEAIGLLGGPPDSPPRQDFPAELKPSRISLLLTTACTMRCAYCYAAAGDRPARHMTLETAVRAIRWTVSNAVATGAPRIELSLHGGGEPTANWPVLTGSVEFARECAGANGLDVQVSMATNGMLSADQVDWIATHLNGLTVSFDGLPAVHDANRRTADGKPSSRGVVETMQRLDRLSFPYSIRATVTAEHLARLPDSIDYIFSTCHPASVQVEPIYKIGRGRDAETAETDEFIATFRLARARAREHGGQILFSAARIGSLSDHFCDATKGSFCLSPDGNVTSCYEVFAEDERWAPKFFFGVPKGGGGYEFDAGVLAGLRSQSVHNRAFCSGCFARWDCGGDCYHKALATNGDGEFRGAGRCHIIRELSKDMLIERIAGAGGVVWAEGPAACQ